MLKVLIVEDDNKQLEMLADTIMATYPLSEIHKASSYKEAESQILSSVSENSLFNLFFLDIQLSKEPGDRGGFFLAQIIRKQPAYFRTPLLFLTSVSDENYFALSNFHCYNYISKPYTSDDIKNQLQQMFITGYIDINTFEIFDTQRIFHRLNITSILYVSVDSHTIILHTVNGNITSRQYSLEAIKKLLGESFIQCHKGYLVNKEHITNLDFSTKLITIADKTIPLGRNYIPVLKSLNQ